VTKLQEAALKECEEARRRRTQPLAAGVEAAPTGTAAPADSRTATVKRPGDVPELCKAAYDHAHGHLGDACCLVFDTETSGFGGCVLQLGWTLACADGNELAAYEKKWLLPTGERIHSKAFEAHGISAAQLRREGVSAKPELAEFFALVAAALAAGVRVVAHNASFDVRHLNHTATVHKLSSPLRSASMLCTMYSATKHCGLRKRGNKALKPPRNEELYIFLFNRKPQEQLHSALGDSRVTLASYIEGRRRMWW
jgi:DNA polymerase-3 subunit epsilon